ncbi:hypothetical protein [Saccharopolyspora gloriosae]|nr:hypothetical protein [Saccharopolyspora gloriosae]
MEIEGDRVAALDAEITRLTGFRDHLAACHANIENVLEPAGSVPGGT